MLSSSGGDTHVGKSLAPNKCKSAMKIDSGFTLVFNKRNSPKSITDASKLSSLGFQDIITN